MLKKLLKTILTPLNPFWYGRHLKEFITNSWFSAAGRQEFHGRVKQDLKKNKSRLLPHRDPSRNPKAPGAPDMGDFSQVLACWGIEQNQLRSVIWGLSFQTIIIALFGLFGLWLLVNSPVALMQVGGCFLIFMAVLTVPCRLWRIQVLCQEEFVFFRQWFLWGLFASAKEG